MHNKSQTLLDIFQEILAAGNSSDRINETQIKSVMREQASSSNASEDFEAMLVKMMRDAQNKLIPSSDLVDACAGYCAGEFRAVIETYNSLHGYATLLVCTIGVLSNTLNIAVLTRRDMSATPINRLLKWLAVADVFVMVEYIPFAVYRYLILPESDYRYSKATYILFHMHYGQILHTASIMLTLSLAIWRYIAINYSDRSNVLCTERRCSIAILTSFLLPPILCIPTFMVFKIHKGEKEDALGNVYTAYHVDSDHYGTLYQVNFWVHAVVIKLLPCFILTVISVWLIRALYSANQHQKNLRNRNACPAAEKMVTRQHKADKRTDRTTKMLLAILLLFLVTELPQGVLGLLSGIMGWCFFTRCYNLFGDMMDFLALLNGSINFVLYCAMSRQFRQTFRQMMMRAPLVKFLPPNVSHSDNQNTCTEKVKCNLSRATRKNGYSKDVDSMRTEERERCCDG